MSHTAGQRGKTVSFSCTLPNICRRPKGSFSIMACVNYDQEVHKRIKMHHDLREVGQRSGVGVIPNQLRGHLPVQLSFLTIMQESGLSPVPIREGPDAWV